MKREEYDNYPVWEQVYRRNVQSMTNHCRQEIGYCQPEDLQLHLIQCKSCTNLKFGYTFKKTLHFILDKEYKHSPVQKLMIEIFRETIRATQKEFVFEYFLQKEK